MSERIRRFDWSLTPLGELSGWPQSLRTSVSLMLNSQHPMWIGWRPEITFLYNDAYRSVLGESKHQWALGRAASEVWAEIWDICGPLAAKVFERGEATFLDDVRLFMRRSPEFLEETFYSFSYSPIRDESGGVGGLFCPSSDVTAKNIGARRLATLSELAARALVEKTTEKACRTAGEILARNRDDIPFALLYLVDAEGARAVLQETVRLAPASEFAPVTIPLRDARDGCLWPVAQVTADGELAEVSLRKITLPFTGAADQPVTRAVVVPLRSASDERPLGVLVAGANPTRRLDDEYRTFFRLVAGQIAAAVTNARISEEQRQRAEALAELDRAKTTFFSNVSHELRTPLTLMLGPLEDLLRPSAALPEQARALAEIAQRNGLRLLKLVNTLLDFSRIEAGRVQASYLPTDLAAFTADLASVFRTAAERAGLNLVVDCPPLSQPAYVDREMWEKFVLNLLSNALKFTFAGEIRIALRERGDRIELTVSDTGVGIPAEELPRLFERFHRVRGTRSRSHEGTGIGLALVQELARLHAGEVKVESVEGQGSTFRVTIRTGSAHLPREKVTHSDSAEPAPIQAGAFLEEAGRWLAEEPEFAPPARLSTRVGSLQRRIVLADDNADMRGYVGKLLTAEGFVVETAADGREALQMITRAQPDLVLSDVMMPQLNGFELLAKLRAQEKTRAIPVIMLSARAGEEARVEGLDAGADDYLIKPFSARELIARVNSQLQMARLRREGEERVTRIVESIRDGFQALDAQWRFTYINEAARQMMREQGLNPDEFIGKHFFNDAFPDVLGTRAESEFRRAVEQRIPAIFENYYAPWKRWFWVRAFPVQDGGISIFFQDIDDRKRQEEKLEELVSVRTKKLQATIADLEAFSYSVSHDLRSPLRAMQGYADELLKMAADGLSDEHRTYLQRIHRAASRLDLLTQEVLSYSKLARAEIEVAPLNLRKLVGDIIEQYPNLRESGALITVAEPLENVVGNDAYLTQALSNLLSNAVKFIPPGKRAEVRVSTERRGPFARIVVQDNGIGIDEKHRSRIFQIFGRVHPESKYPGTGVGLAIVKKAVEKMNGQAGFEPGEVGSRFWIELPAADTVLLRRQETPARVSSK